MQTTLGLSNISFGLNPAARQVLNSVFLHECQEAGLDSAIVHASKILPMNRIDEKQREVALDLVYDRRREGYDPLQRTHGDVRGRVGGLVEGVARRGAGQAAVCSSGWRSASSTANATGWRPISTRR